MSQQDRSPYCIFPAMSHEEFEAFKASIAERGVEIPAILDQDGNVIDGHNRRKACDELGIACPVEVRAFKNEAEKYELALTLNSLRRQLNTQQKRGVIGTYLKRDTEIANNHLATILGVDDHTVGSVREALEATSEIPKLEKFRGRDGKVRTRHKIIANTPTEALGLIDNLPELLLGKTLGPIPAHGTQWGGRSLLNNVVQGDCRDVIPRMPDNSIALSVTSPPYAEQRKGIYPGVPEKEYPEFTVEWMSLLWPKLTSDGSVLIVIDPHVENGELADYVLLTQLALRAAGWKQHMPLIWLKENRCPLGHTGWPRHAYEQILWFSKTTKPFCNPKAGGRKSLIKAPRYRYSGWFKDKSYEGVPRATDVIDVPVSLTPEGVDHPAMFPVELAERLIPIFCRPGGTVWDGFAGSGNSLIAAARLGHPFCGCDIVPKYVETARRRLTGFDGGAAEAVPA